ncbi:alpha/beta fold hydrolase [Mycolicibacterium setense]
MSATMVMVLGSHIVVTSALPVEVRYLPAQKPPLLIFPGGHASAAMPTGEQIYTDLGYGVVCFSRPGYGRTDVGALSASQFVPLVVETCRQLDIMQTAGAVGVSFGGLQAIHTAVAAPELAP